MPKMDRTAKARKRITGFRRYKTLEKTLYGERMVRSGFHYVTTDGLIQRKDHKYVNGMRIE